ncbi:hypothetical protein L873DRAFT_1848385 [Choiromyces venosus 120613-1]|uniref:Nucleoporin Nup133/Nup155-like C-terminal domain-containing protein n=1 Tax=Choiromyces venosus 120613-1 TaxID=1336337 RepID=A0A3N4IYN6_9PEZI|nr:hypothetical protein L873DRAFT_1848385 [Choiromyces venosus 120613-1]
MFSSNHPSVESAAAARRRHRPTSRPSSRTQHRQERSGSNASMSRNVRESSVISQRGGGVSAGSFTERELSSLGKAMIMASARGDGKNVDGGVVDWTKNTKFRVSKLPALPPPLKTANPTPITAATEGSNGYALVLSHTAAYVWQYTSGDSIPHTFSFPLPNDEQGANSPFPLGSLVSPSANSDEPGLVVVMPLSGRTAYWDSVGSAVAEGLFSKRRGVEGKVPLISGESVTAVCNAEPAGFILSLSSGRLAHLALRDPAGRPGITVTIMRGYGTGMVGGFLGALRAGSSRRDIVAVRAGRILRMGEREIIVATARGNFSRWQVNRSGTYANIADVDVRDNILSAIEQAAPHEVQLRSKDAFVIVDAAVGENHDTAEGDDVDVLVLASFMPTPNSPGALHVLVSLKFRSGGRLDVCDVHVVRCYTTPLEEGKTRPRLYLPRPGRTAFLVFSRAVVLVSTQKPEADDDDEMNDDTEDQGAFEDVVDFRGDLHIEIVGSGPEDVMFDSTPRSDMMGSFTSDTGGTGAGKKIRNPGVMLVAKGAGIVRLEAFDLEPVKKRVLAEPIKVKSKIEQAVFYGVKEDNPLNFQGREEIKYEIAEIEEAALEISQEILSSTSEYLPAVLPSLDTHLSLRAAHLRALAEHLRSTFPPLSKKTMWRLLTDAEKCHAARAVWNVRETHLRHRQEGEEGALEVIIPELLSSDDDIGGSDPIRTWFLRYVGSIEDLIPKAKHAMVEKTGKGRYEKVAMAKMDAEANDIVLAALMKAWEFRVRSVKLYRLDRSGIDSNGIMNNTTGLPPPWTSGTDILQALSVHHEVSVAMIKTLWGPRLASDVEGKEIIERVAEQLVGLAEVCCRGFEERSFWCEQQSGNGEGTLQEGITIKERYIAQRGGWIKPLAELGMAEKAYDLAEKWQDYRTLVELCSEDVVRIEATQKSINSAAAATTSTREAIERENAELARTKRQTIERMEAYFERFGEVYAIEMYEYLVEHGQLQKLLNGFERWRESYLTKFLHSSPRYAKLSWIHDVGLGEYALAADTLLTIATEQEEDQWNKKVQLSIGKLAKIAAMAAGGYPDEQSLRTIDSELELVGIQSRVYEAVKLIGKTSIDTDGAVQIGLERYAGGTLTSKKRAGCRELWKRAFARAVEGKVMGVEEVADLLTLADADGDEDDAGGTLLLGAERGEEFYWALRALSLGGLPLERRKFMEKSIWRRCFLRDNWQSILDTRNKSDTQVQTATHKTAVYKTIKLGHERGLFAQNSPYQPLAPEETFFSESLEELRTRFACADESELATIGMDLAQENKLLARFLERAELRVWFPGVLDAARRDAYGGYMEEEGDGEEEMLVEE